MEMASFKEQIKTIAKENGAALVGVASRERLYDAPPSGNPEYLLPTTRSIISIAIPFDRKILREYFTKKAWLSHGVDEKHNYEMHYRVCDRLVDFLKSKGFEALCVDGNSDYRPEPGAKDATQMTEYIPDFSHRYGAVASGLGRLGWSGNVVTPEFGASVQFGTVLTSAVLQADPLLDKNPCDRCKICTSVCPVEMMSKKESVAVTVAGITDEIAKKRPNTCCMIGCADYHGLAPNKKWSNWTPYRVDLPMNKAEIDKICNRVMQADPEYQVEESFFNNFRGIIFNPDYMYIATCGNCGKICWERKEDREENHRIIVNSGIVVLNLDGERVATHDDIVELDTPYIVRFAMSKKEYERALAAKKTILSAESGHTAMDRAVLSHLVEKVTHAFPCQA